MTEQQKRYACAPAFVILLTFALAITCATAAEVRKGWFTPACAARDLRALDAIEQFSAIDEMPTAWLVEAGLSLLEARVRCLAGDEADGIALYERIIAGDARLSHAAVMK